MSLETAELETDMFFAEGELVYRRGALEMDPRDNATEVRSYDEELICRCEPEVEKAAEQIAHALNRLPKLEAFLIRAAGVIRGGEEAELNRLAAEIEELICG